MTAEDIQYFKDKLTTEKTLLESELLTVGRKNPDKPSDWEATAKDLDVLNADEGDVAESMEEMESNSAILRDLDLKYQNVMRALGKIASGNYGICEIGGERIETDRLEANPSARTCIVHMNEENTLL